MPRGRIHAYDAQSSDLPRGVIEMRTFAQLRDLTDEAGHDCIVYEVHPEPGNAVEKDGAVPAAALDDVVKRLTRRVCRVCCELAID